MSGVLVLIIAAVVLPNLLNKKDSTNTNYSQNNYSIQDEKKSAEFSEMRAKRSNQLYDKYEKLIKQNRRNPLKAIQLLEDDGFHLSLTTNEGNAIMYDYIKNIDGFEIEAGYLDSPNPGYSEVVLVKVKDTEIK